MSGQSRNYQLLSPVMDGKAANTVLYADALDFTSDGSLLVYCALNRVRDQFGFFRDTYSIYFLERSAGQRFALAAPDPGYNVGNPALGQRHNNYLKFEAGDSSQSVSYAFAKDFASPAFAQIGAVNSLNGVAFPSYSGRSDAIVFTDPGFGTIAARAVGADGVTPTGNAFEWISGHVAGIYRRSADFNNQSQAVVFTDDANNSFEFPDLSYYRNFGRLRCFNSGSGNDRFTFSAPRETEEVSCHAGDDVVNMGLGVDQVFGHAGEDLLIADWSIGDSTNLGGIYNTGSALARNNTTTNTVVDSIQAPEFDHIYFTGGSKGDVLTGSDGSDVLKGMRGSDQRRTYAGDDFLLGCDPLNGRGAGEVDQLTGDGGSDVFVLGDAEGRFYDDGNASSPGHDGYAKIPDFNSAQDKLKLHGPASSYLIGASPISGVAGTALFHDSNSNGTLDATRTAPSRGKVSATLPALPCPALPSQQGQFHRLLIRAL